MSWRLTHTLFGEYNKQSVVSSSMEEKEIRGRWGGGSNFWIGEDARGLAIRKKVEFRVRRAEKLWHSRLPWTTVLEMDYRIK